MKSIVDFEKVLNVFVGHGCRITGKLNQALENSGPARLDEAARELFLELGDLMIQEVFKQMGESIRHSDQDPPDCECCGKPLKFKQMRKMPVRSALTGKGSGSPGRFCLVKNCTWRRTVE